MASGGRTGFARLLLMNPLSTITKRRLKLLPCCNVVELRQTRRINRIMKQCCLRCNKYWEKNEFIKFIRFIKYGEHSSSSSVHRGGGCEADGGVCCHVNTLSTKTPSPFGYSLYKQRESWNTLRLREKLLSFSF